MRIIEIEPLSNGGHRNQTGEFTTIPDGWAVVPDGMEVNNFPFGNIETEVIDEVATVTKWEAIEIPKPEDTTQMPSKLEQLRADVDYLAIMTGVEL